MYKDSISHYNQCSKCLLYFGFYCFCLVNVVRGRNISISLLRYSAHYNALESWPIRARLASQNDELCFRKADHIGATIMYIMYVENNVFNLKPHKHIALHQIHKIMLFLATPFKTDSSLKMSESKIYNRTEWTELNFFCGKGTETIFTQKLLVSSWGGILTRQWSFFKTFHAKDPHIYMILFFTM